MVSHKGFIATGYLYLIGGIVVIAMLSGIAYKIRESGKDAIRLEWADANRKEKERLDRERDVRNSITDKREAEHATDAADRDARYRAALLGLRKPAVNGEAKPLSQAATVVACPSRQANVAGGLERLEEGILGLLERGDKAIARSITCRDWLQDQAKVKVQ